MIVNFKSKSTEKVGNKAKFLMMMKQDGFNVPDGFVIDSDTFIEEVKNNKLDTKINKLLKKINEDNIRSISEEITKLFDSFKFSKETISKVEEYASKNKLYAVRSSGTKEDLDNFSFAGQYETFLNTEYKDILNKVVECYKSMYSEVILSYFVNNDISFENMAMSVVVQEMVQSEYSGICFTIDPITGDDKTMLIEVGKGLGENIVSGQNKPEQYYYNWYDGKVKFKTSNKYLTNKVINEMANTFFDIMQYFGYPCDIEFAIVKNEVFVLQARRITKIKYDGYKYLWSTADFKDGGVSATICKPYMWSLYEYIWEYTLKKFILDSKILKEEELPKKLGDMFYARPYWNMSAVKLAMSKIIGYKEREFDSEYGINPTYDGDGETTKVSLKSIVAIIRMALAQKKIVKTREKNADFYFLVLLNKYYTYKEMYDEDNIEDIKKDFYTLTHDYYLQSESTYFWQIFINTVHQSLQKDSILKYIEDEDYLTLISNIDDISHLLPFYDMWDVSRKIREDKESFEYWKSTPIEKIVKYATPKKKKYNIQDVYEVINNYGYHSDK